MQNGGFLDNRSAKPVGLGIIIAAHVAVLTAIAVSHPDMVPGITFVPLETIRIQPDKSPPPPPPPAREVDRTQPTRIDALIKTAASDETPVIRTDPVATIDLPTLPYQPPKIEPVFGSATIDPRAQAAFQPDYPLTLIRAGIEGFATVRVLIGSDGRVKSVENVNASDPAFFEATQKQALRYWRFRPATSDGVATESWRTMTVRFKIQS